jgi:hypothetical protein
MKELIKCKSCGYIMEQGKLRDKCPACGVPAKMFESYTENISPKRKMILSLDFHPVMVHFAQAFTFTILVILIAVNFLSGEIRQDLLVTAKILSICLPFAIVMTIAAGIVDGKVRFRRINTPALVQKLMLGSVFLILSAVNLAVTLMYSFQSSGIIIAGIALMTGALLCGSVLALIGVGLINAKFPG